MACWASGGVGDVCWVCVSKQVLGSANTPSGTVKAMSPTIVRDGQFRLFFFSREETRIHVHVAHPAGEAKFWLTPSVHLAKNVGLSGVQLRQAQTVVEAHIQEIQDAWNYHFGG
jgi:hypothetical protein